jgi:hypothetical protein
VEQCKEYRQYAYRVTLRLVHETIVAVDKYYIFCVRVCVCVCVCVALIIQHAKRMRRIVICGRHGSTILFDIL